MSVFRLTSMVLTLSTVWLLASADRSLPSEWGCEVLLCASSSNPSWRDVPACHPPMSRLISAMSHVGFQWPTCPEASTGKPGYERYEECPAGWSIGYSLDRRRASKDADLCIGIREKCDIRGKESARCDEPISMARPLRSKPYFFDIPDGEGQVTRYWFDLKH